MNNVNQSYNDWNKNPDGVQQNYVYTPPQTWQTGTTSITTSSDNDEAYICLENIEVSQELIDELGKLMSTRNISVSLRGVTIKKDVKDSEKPHNTSDEEFEIAFQAARDAEIKKVYKDAELIPTNDPAGVLELLTEETKLEEPQPQELIGEDPLEKVVEKENEYDTLEDTRKTLSQKFNIFNESVADINVLNRIHEKLVEEEIEYKKHKSKVVGEDPLPEVIKEIKVAPVKQKSTSEDYNEHIQSEYIRLKQERIERLKSKYKENYKTNY